MALSAGNKLGPYEILASIGRGGMGEVYRARDTKLKRDVALKILPEAFARDPDRMMRFQREAEVLASLNHPNIAQIYGVEEQALAMELVEGKSPSGPMVWEAAWKVASQITDALAYAHDKGVVHRDLKPDNIKVTQDGTVRLLDFGLAKAFTAVPDATVDATNLSTFTMDATMAGAIMGTPAYMSPEQARGWNVDKRTDIWSFGVVLYELVSGRRPFRGRDVTETLASLIKDEPPWESIPREAQPLLRKCLKKDPKERLRDIGDAALLLQGKVAGPPPSAARPRLAWALSAAAILASLGLWITGRIAPHESSGMAKASLLYPDVAVPTNYAVPAISPDGRRVAFVASSEANGALGQLFVRDLGSLAARPLAGTNGASYPFWSPDGTFIGFFADRKLKKIDAQGAPPVTLADAAAPLGGSWSSQDVILYRADSTGLRRISATGGGSAAVTRSDSSETGNVGDMLPWFLPDGRHFLYTSISFDNAKSTIYVSDLEASNPTQSRRKVVDAVSNAVYSAEYLLFVQERTLMAQRFDLGKLQMTGDPVRSRNKSITALVERIARFPHRKTALWCTLLEMRPLRFN